ncbi:MAG: ATP synthase F0 subunit A [Calditrichaeota bacterium]|nr:MAG: ATP synthase F0 subunit A [Calditrichota bacterium]
MHKYLKVSFLILVLAFFSSAIAGGNTEGESHGGDEKVNGEVIIHHMLDASYLDFYPIPVGDHGKVHLPAFPAIIVNGVNGFIDFTSVAKSVNPTVFAQEVEQKNGIVIDMSITKHVFFLFVAALVCLLIFTLPFKKAQQGEIVVRKGFSNLLETIVVFIRDEIVYPNMGEVQGRKFLPLLLTIFFFILICNLLGLVPFGATATGNVNVTAGLALITFFATQIFGNKDYWKHVFATPGVPVWLLPIMIPVEVMGLFTKPFALTMRLFANMTAGHVIILALIGLIINFKSYGVALGAVPGAAAIFGLELFVALLQSYIFTLLSAMFIGAAVEEHHHEEAH